jgi:hypothetical protein
MRSHVYLSLDEIRPAIEINATWEGSRHTTTCEPGKRRARGKVPSEVSRDGTPAPRLLELILLAERGRGGRGSRGLRTDLSRSGDADRAGLRHEVGGPCHEYAGCAEEQQQS